LEICSVLNLPAVYDNLHNKLNPCDTEKYDYYWINECKNTWKKIDENQKIHYSQQDPNKKPGSHSSCILLDEFIDFYKGIKRDDIDIMLEVKDKNVSAVNCIRSLELENENSDKRHNTQL